MSLRSPQNMEILVMPAWIARHPGWQHASGDIHVSLDSSAPCWNDAIEAALLEVTEGPLPRIFKEATKSTKITFFVARTSSVLRALRGDHVLSELDELIFDPCSAQSLYQDRQPISR